MPAHASNEPRQTPDDRPPLRLAVVGAEGRGAIAQHAHDPGANVWLVAASTLEPDRIAGLRERFGNDFQITSDYREILARADIDAVFVCTPDFLHEEHVLAAIAAGKHVFAEKPLAISIAGCDRILRAAAARGVTLYPGHNMRFFPVMRKMRDLVAAGAIGEVQAIWCRHFISYGGDAYFRDWHSERRHTHGLLLQKTAHDLDMIHWFAGSYTRRVVGMGKLSVYDRLPRRPADAPAPRVIFDRNQWPPKATRGYSPHIDVEDHSMLLLELENGVQASYLQCHYTPDDHRNYTIIGTEGRIENFGDHSVPEHWASVHVWNRRTGYAEHGHEVHRIPHLEGSHGGADPLIVADFVRALREGRSEGATPLDARMAVTAGYLGTESLRAGSMPMDVPAPAADA